MAAPPNLESLVLDELVYPELIALPAPKAYELFTVGLYESSSVEPFRPTIPVSGVKLWPWVLLLAFCVSALK